ncbi:MAG: isochorismatase family protein [Streptosporangiales bacterium]|nr:isochorismatase family protein [Streptosporangiales bacterium]
MTAWADAVGDDIQDLYRAAGYGRPGGLGTSPAVLVVDVTYAFTGERSEPIREAIKRNPKSSGEYAWRAIDALTSLLPVARAAGVPVIYSRNAPRTTSTHAGGWGRKLAGASSGVGDDIVAEIGPVEGDLVVEKTKPSIFFGTPLSSWLIDLGVDTLLVCGGTTSGCIRATVVDAFSYNFRVGLVAEATFDRADLIQQVNLFDIGQKYADVIDVAAATAYLTTLPGSRDGNEA